MATIDLKVIPSKELINRKRELRKTGLKGALDNFLWSEIPFELSRRGISPSRVFHEA